MELNSGNGVFLFIFAPITPNNNKQHYYLMKRYFLLFICSCLISCFSNAASISNNESLIRLYKYAGKDLNYIGFVSEDRILDLCAKMERLARKEKDYDNLFRIQLIAVNSNCLKGNLGQAVCRAREMYNEARKLNSELGIALAIQAIGDTYMYSNELSQAYAAFEEADERLQNINDNYSKTRLLVEKLHVCLLMKNVDRLQHYLIEMRKLLDRIDIPNKSDYVFYLQCYQTFYYLSVRDADLALINLETVKKLKPADESFDRWYYKLSFHYFELKGNYLQASLYCDSIASSLMKNRNLNEYKNVLTDRAALLEKSGNKREACELYQSARKLTDSLNLARYSQQIDSLRVTYWVDQMEIENTTMNNRMLTWVILSSLFILLAALVLIYLVRQKNKRLEASRKELEEFRQIAAGSIQSKNLFLSNMSHELRTPLNAIVGFSDLLASNDVEDEATRLQCCDLIKQNSELLLKLFSDVADLSALKGDNISFVFNNCDAVVLCNNVIDTVEKVKRTSANVGFQTSLEHLPLYTDSGRLQQVLINLLINATKFTQQGMITLKLNVDAEKNEAVFTIEDTGCGIPLERQPHIFERFEKLHEGVQGAGLGLSICQLIVEHVGGRIWIDSTYVDGARFVFTHPLSSKKEE